VNDSQYAYFSNPQPNNDLHSLNVAMDIDFFGVMELRQANHTAHTVSTLKLIKDIRTQFTYGLLLLRSDDSSMDD
jgi:hypothetical protein